MRQLAKVNHFSQPFPVALGASLVDLLDGDGLAGAPAGRAEGGLLNPAFVHRPEAAVAEQAIWPEVHGGLLELLEGESPEIS